MNGELKRLFSVNRTKMHIEYAEKIEQLEKLIDAHRFAYNEGATAAYNKVDGAKFIAYEGSHVYEELKKILEN